MVSEVKCIHRGRIVDCAANITSYEDHDGAYDTSVRHFTDLTLYILLIICLLTVLLAGLVWFVQSFVLYVAIAERAHQ